jgi:single-stranded-DNA-specific exonuclease
LPSADLPELRLRLDAFARARLTAEDLLPELRIDAEISLNDVTPELLKGLRQLEPFGQGNPEPVFASQCVNLLLPPRIIKEKHLKLRVSQPQSSGRTYNYDAMGWRMADRLTAEAYRPGDQLDLAFTVTVNPHPDFGGLELVLEDFRKSAPAAIPVYI